MVKLWRRITAAVGRDGARAEVISWPKAGGLDLRRGGANILVMTVQPPIPFHPAPHAPEQVAFDRQELGRILGLYGRMVAAGEWRDYAVSVLRDRAVFSVFRRSAEHPLYRIEKHPRLRNRQGMYALFGMDGQILKRGHDLAGVLRDLDRKLIRPVD
jgi:hypothetical protein